MPEQILDPAIQQKVEELKSSFETKVKAYQSEFNESKKQIDNDYPDPDNIETFIGIDVVVDWKDVKISIDLPEFVMQTQNLSLDLPSITMSLQEISFDVPQTTMTTRCVANGPVWYGPFTVKWECIGYADFPEVTMKTTVIKTDIPQITMERMDFSIDLPEVTMKTQEMVLTLPQITVREVSVTIAEKKDAIQNAAGNLTQKINSEQGQFKMQLAEEINEPTKAYIQNVRTEILSKRQEVSDSFNPAIQKLKDAINILKQNNANDKVAELEGVLSNLVTKYQEALSSIDNGLIQQLRLRCV
jgi:hypothetical protein